MRKLNSLETAIGLGIVLVAVPTAFTVFPELTELSARWRGVIVFIWLILGGVALTSGAVRDQQIDKVTEGLAVERIELRRQLETAAFSETLRVLLDPASFGIPACFEFTVYVFDPTEGLLRPIYPVWDEGEGDDVRVFEPGNGATGRAWETGDLFIVKGEAVSTQKYGLSLEQQEYWDGYERSISYPLYEDLSEKIGALTALSKEPNDFFDEPAGRALYERLANIVALQLLRVAPTNL